MKPLPGILTIALLMASARAQPPKATPSPTPAQQPGKHVSLTYPIYQIPKNAVVSPRQDGDAGTRGWSEKLPSLYVLAPNHTGLTTRGQPSLFWYQSGPASTRIELTIIEPKNPKPVLRVGADKVEQGGIHRLPLARYNVKLTPGVLYKWTIALIPDPANRSRDIIASDTIQRIEPDTRLTAALAGSKGLGAAAVYASNGIWYDALEAISDELDASPMNKDIRLLRASLLDRVGLKTAAVAERKIATALSGSAAIDRRGAAYHITGALASTLLNLIPTTGNHLHSSLGC
jgi:hypothetical protein